MPRGGPRIGPDGKSLAGRKPNPNKINNKAGTATRPSPDMRALISALPSIMEANQKTSRRREREQGLNPFKLPEFPKAAVPQQTDLRMAMDSNLQWASDAWLAGSLLNSAAVEGLMFPGYAYLSELAQRPEYRIISETIADDATRKWIMFDITGTEREKEDRAAEDAADPEGAEERRTDRIKASGKTDKVRDLMDFLVQLEARQQFYRLIAGDGFFGRHHLFLSFGNDTDEAELKTPIGNGRDALSKAKVGTDNPLRRLKAIEPVWTYPMAYNAINPLLDDWYNPQYWYVMGRELHVTRILPFVSREVPDILKPSYAFGGISLSQLAQPYVDIWLRTRQSVADMIHSFSVMVLQTNLSTATQPTAAADLLGRMALFNMFRDNQGVFITDKNTEDLKNVSAPMSGLHELQAQAQEHMSFPARIPLVKLTGISPAGLNASSEGEIRVYYDTINSFQNRTVRPVLTRVVNFAQLSLWGEVDPDLTLEFEPLWDMSRKEEAELQKAQAERDKIFVDGGAISPEEWRETLINDPTLPFGGLDPEDVPDLREEEDEGLVPGKGGGAPGGPAGGSEKEPGAEDATILPFWGAHDESEWSETKHPRAPDGKFGSGGGAKAHSSEKSGSNVPNPLKATDLKKIGAQMGSNPGGVFEDKSGQRFYVKAGKSTDHVANELLAADLLRLAGGQTLDYRPVEGGKHVATAIADLDKKNAHDFTPEERKAAQRDFIAQAWLANWDAVGLGGDNLGIVNGKPTALDLGGALAYRAQGAPKGAAFGDKVGEIETLRSKSMNADAAAIYGSMSTDDLRRSAERVTRITNDRIGEAVKKFGGSKELAEKLIARKRDIAKRFELATDEAPFEESKHPRDKGGKFAETSGGGGSSSGGGKEDDDVPKAGAYGGLWKVSPTNTPEANFAMTVGTYINAKPQIGIHYRRMMTKLLKDADKYGVSPELKEKVKTKLVDSLWGSLATAKQKGKQDEVIKIAKTIEKLTGKALNEKTLEVTKPESKSTLAPAKPFATPKATPEEMKLAAKVTNLMMPPGKASPEGNKLVEAFNKKYGTGTTPLTDPTALAQKVADFKELKTKVDETYAAHQAEIQAKAKKQAAALKAKQTAEAEAAKEKNKAVMAELGITEQEAEGFNALVGMLGKSQQDVVTAFHGYEQKAKQLGYPITGFQAALISNYSDGGYIKINESLREGAWTPAEHVYAKMVNKALAKMPAFTGTVHRGTSLTENQIDAYREGHIIQEQAFMSTSPSNPFGGNVRFNIKAIGRRGASIKQLSNHPGESEVLFRARTFFKVNAVTKNGGQTVIDMEEWEDDDR